MSNREAPGWDAAAKYAFSAQPVPSGDGYIPAFTYLDLLVAFRAGEGRVVAAVEALHPDNAHGDEHICRNCFHDWPCEVVRAARGAGRARTEDGWVQIGDPTWRDPDADHLDRYYGPGSEDAVRVTIWEGIESPHPVGPRRPQRGETA